MLLAATTGRSYAIQPWNGPDTRAPNTPFAATQANAKKDWLNDFLSGVQTGLGVHVQVVPISDAQTPNVNTASTPSAGAAITTFANQNPTIMLGLLAVLAFIVYKKVG